MMYGKVMMNFGERLKQIRTEQGLTQPQFAQAAGIEQSYLSKLENDKSVPSAEMFSSIVAAVGMDPAAFLEPVDKAVLATTLRHIPAVAHFTSQVVAKQTHETKLWLFGAAAAWVVGFALLLAANDGIFFSNRLYKYTSPGVVQAGEADNIFENHAQILALKLGARTITDEEMSAQMAQFQANRVRPRVVEWPNSRGTVYSESSDSGHRNYQLIHTEYVQAPGNRILQFIGAIVAACGFAALFIEWRLRRARKQSSLAV